MYIFKLGLGSLGTACKALMHFMGPNRQRMLLTMRR